MEEDFAATTTIGERVVPAVAVRERKTTTGAQGPSFGVPAKLEPFTLLAKSARGASAAALVSQACAAPGVYVFAELLALPSIADLKNNEQHKASYELLEIFAYGTWGEYAEKKESHSLPTLNKAQETKLKHLTILTLALDNRIIPYTTLLSSLSLPSIPALEDLLIEAFYSNVLKGRLDQREARLEVLSSIGRDVRPFALPVTAAAITASGEGGEPMELDSNAESSSSSSKKVTSPSVQSLTTDLGAWLSTIRMLLTSLDRHIAEANADAVNQAAELGEHQEAVERMAGEVEKNKGKGGSGKEEGSGGWKESLLGGVGKFVGAATGGGGDVDMDQGEGGSARGVKGKSGDSRLRKRGRT